MSWLKYHGMPILRHREKLILFTHVPKCAGQSIEQYCESVGISVAFLDNSYKSFSHDRKPWSISSPQHIDGLSMARLFPNSYFDDYFAVIRHPLNRLRSAFKFQKYIENKINNDLGLSDFIKGELDYHASTFGSLDNHFVPQTKMLIPGRKYRVFRLEKGMKHIKNYIDETIFQKKLSQKIIQFNVFPANIKTLPSDSQFDDLSLEKAFKIYKEDFINFGYKIEEA